MISAYDEAQSLGYRLNNLIDNEMKKISEEKQTDNKIFDAAYRYGAYTAFTKAKEIIEYLSNKDAADLLNDSRKLEEMEDELNRYKEEENKKHVYDK